MDSGTKSSNDREYGLKKGMNSKSKIRIHLSFWICLEFYSLDAFYAPIQE